MRRAARSRPTRTRGDGTSEIDQPRIVTTGTPCIARQRQEENIMFGGTEQEKLAWEDYHRGLVDPEFTPNVVYGNGHHPECLCGQCFPDDDDDPADLIDLAVRQ